MEKWYITIYIGMRPIASTPVENLLIGYNDIMLFPRLYIPPLPNSALTGSIYIELVQDMEEKDKMREMEKRLNGIFSVKATLSVPPGI